MVANELEKNPTAWHITMQSKSGVCALLLNVSFQSQQRSMSNLVEYTTLQMFWLSGIFSAIECTWIIRLSWLKLLLTCTRRKKNGKDYVERSNTCSTLMAPQKILLLSVAAMKQTPLKSVVVVLPCSTAKHKCCCHLGPFFCFRLLTKIPQPLRLARFLSHLAQTNFNKLWKS